MKLTFNRYNIPEFEILKPYGKWINNPSPIDIIFKYSPGNSVTSEFHVHPLWYVLDRDKFEMTIDINDIVTIQQRKLNDKNRS